MSDLISVPLPGDGNIGIPDKYNFEGIIVDAWGYLRQKL
jgi:hypothetical protein